jgi:hypothetical protein
MTSISYFAPSPRAISASRHCRKKASDCQRTALTSDDPKIRRVYLKLAELWREMAVVAEWKEGEPSQKTGVVVAFPKRTGR